jgi:hypothetical protein
MPCVRMLHVVNNLFFYKYPPGCACASLRNCTPSTVVSGMGDQNGLTVSAKDRFLAIGKTVLLSRGDDSLSNGRDPTYVALVMSEEPSILTLSSQRNSNLWLACVSTIFLSTLIDILCQISKQCPPNFPIFTSTRRPTLNSTRVRLRYW